MQFDSSKPDSANVLPGSASALTECETVLGLASGTIGKALTKRKIKAGNEYVEQDLTVEKANDGRDALSKVRTCIRMPTTATSRPHVHVHTYMYMPMCAHVH